MHRTGLNITNPLSNVALQDYYYTMGAERGQRGIIPPGLQSPLESYHCNTLCFSGLRD
jgi:hypothetical protein